MFKLKKKVFTSPHPICAPGPATEVATVRISWESFQAISISLHTHFYQWDLIVYTFF